MSSRWSSVVSLLLVAACSAGLTSRSPHLPHVVSDADWNARLSAGQPELLSIDVVAERARLRRIAELDARLGSREEAIDATARVVASARLDLALARAGQGDLAAAHKAADEATGFALGLARELGAPRLFMHVVDPAHLPADLVAELGHAAPLAEEWTPELRSATWRALADRPADRAELERAWSGDDDAPRLTVAELGRLGAGAADLLEARLLVAAGAHDVAAVRELTPVLLAADAWDLHGRLAAAWLADIDAGRLAADHVAVLDVVGREGAFGAAARLERASHAHPQAKSLVLALAARYSFYDLLGDGQALVAPLAAAGASGDVADTARLLQALFALGAGDLRGYAAWADRDGRARGSAYLTDDEITRGRSQGAPAALVGRGLSAARRAYAAGLGTGATRVWGGRGLAADDGAPVALRERAIAELRYGGASFVAEVLEDCVQRRIARDACETRVAQAETALGQHDDDEEGDDDADGSAALAERVHAIVALGSTLELPAAVFEDPFAMTQAELLELHATLVAHERGAAALSEDYVVTRVLAEIARGDASAAAAAFARGRALVSPGRGVGLRLALADLRAGVAPDAIQASVAPLGDLGWQDTRAVSAAPDAGAIAEQRTTWPGTARVDALERALGFWRLGARDLAVAELVPLAAFLDGAEGAELNALVALGARSLKDAARFASASARARQLAPHAPGVVYLDRLVAADAGDPAASVRAELALLELHPDDVAALRRYLAARARREAGAAGARAIAALLGALPGEHGNLGFLSTAIADGTLATGADVAAAIAADEDATLGLAAGARFQRVDEIALTVAQAAWVRLGRDDPAGLRDDARAYARYLEGTRLVGEQRRLLAWLWFLAGDGERALTAATRATVAPRINAWSHPVLDPGPLPATAVVRLLAPLRARLSDELAVAIFATEDGRGDPAATAHGLLAATPGETGALVVACYLLGQANLPLEALPTCRQAFDRSGYVDTLVDLSWALSSVDDATARARGPELDAFLTATRRRMRADAGGDWLHNLAIALEKRGRARAALDAELEAWVRGFEPTRFRLAPLTLDEEPWAARLQEAVQGFTSRREYHLRLGLSALRAGDLDVARVHERALRAWGDPGDAAAPSDKAGDFADLLEVAEGDLAARTLDATGVRRVFAASIGKAALTEWEAIDAKWPDSIFVDLFFAEQLTANGRAAEALRLLSAALARYPKSVTIGGDLYGLLVQQRRYKDARELHASLERVHPGDARMASWELPEADEGGVARMPDFAATPASFAARRARVSDAELSALSPVRLARVASAAEAFIPAGWVSDDDGLTAHGTAAQRLGVVAQPRADRCEGQACLDPIVDALAKSGFTALWKAPVALPAGDGYEALLAGPGTTMWLATVPAGAHVFALFAAAPSKDLDAAMPVFELLRRGFRPLDRVVSAREADTLHASVPQELEWSARLEVAAAAPGATTCPLTASLAAAGTDDLRGALVLDALLGAHDAIARRAIIACTAPATKAAAAVALVAVLDEDARVHAWGRAATIAAPARVRADAERVLFGDEGVALSSRGDDDLVPPYGVLEVLEALPGAERQAFAAAIVARHEPRWDGLALLLPGLVPGVLDRAVLRADVLDAAPEVALLATWALGEAPEAADLAAMRTRLGALTGPFDVRTRSLAMALASALAPALDDADAPLFERAALEAEKVAPGASAAASRASAKSLRELGSLHTRGRALFAGQKPPARVTADDATIATWVARKRRAGHVPAARVTDAMLATRPLASFVPGRGWTYARVAQPALFAAGARDLGKRARGASDTDTPAVRRVLDHFATSLVGHVFEASAGLDLGRPIECVSPGRDDAYVCVAYVKDRDAVREELAHRDAGEHTGVRAPLALATQGFFVPLALALVPAFVEMAASSWGENSQADGQRLLLERARGLVEVAGRQLEQVLTVQLRDGRGTRYDGEIFTFVGDRLWLFSDPRLAEDVLTAPPARGTSLAEAPRFVALTRPWKDAGALQAVTMGASAFLDEEVAFEVATSGGGVDFRVGGHVSGAIGDVGAVSAALPAGAASWFAVAQVPEASGAGGSHDFPGDFGDGNERGPAPPVWLVPEASELALAWYPEPGQPLWARWIGAVGLDARVRTALAAHSLELPAPGQVADGLGLSWGLRGDVLVIGTPHALVAEALARPAAPPAGAKKGARRVALGHLDGGRAAAALLALATSKRAGDDSASLYKLAALMVGAASTVELQATADANGAYHLDARLALRVAAPGAADTLLVDEWLSSRGLRNSARLPREVARTELRAPIVLELEVDDAQATATRAFPASPRVHVTVVDERHLRVEVAPGPGLEQPIAATPLTERGRRAALASSGHIVADVPAMRDLARSIVPAGSSPGEAARLVVDWLQKNLRYEVTPEGLDAQTILARGRGDCTEYSILAVSLLRAAGVPAELREGMALDGSELVAHAWVAFHDGTGWREIDPTFGVTFVDAGHLETSVLDFISLVSVGRLKIVRVDAAKP